MADCAPPDLLPLFLAEMAALDERPKAAERTREYRPAAPVPAGSNRPGDDFNARTDPGDYLAGRGWRLDHVQGETRYLTRPGKADGVSASVGRCKTAGGLPRVYVFTSNAAPLEPSTSYDAFGLYAALECGGDRIEAARRLGEKGFGEQAVEVKWSGGKRADRPAADAARPAAPGRRPVAPPPWVPFLTDKLPEPLAGYVRECAGAIGCDEASVAVPLLAVFAGIIGNRRRLVAKPGFVQPCCLWAAVVGLTGTMKSPGWGAADRIADDLDQALEESTKGELAEWRARSNAEGDPGPKPAAEKLIVEDITIETVASTLEQNPNGLLVSMDELSVWFDLFTRYRKGGGSDVSRWLGMWEGRRLKVSRRASGELYIPRALVSVVGTIQPAILGRAVREEERESGFLSRLLLVYPPTNQKRWTEREPSRPIREAVQGVANRLHQLDAADVPMDAEARALYAAYYDELGAAEWLELDEDRRAALAKGPRLTMRLALIHHAVTRLAEAGPFADGAGEAVGAESVEFGYCLAGWFLNELRRVYQVMAGGKDDALVRAVCEWARRKGGRFRVRELYRARRDKFGRADEARDFLDGLAAVGVGSWEADGADGRAVFVLADARPADEDDGD
jgi:hypothetical protein